MRLVDLQLSFPSILVALMILALLGRGVGNVMLALGAGGMGLLRPHRPRHAPWRNGDASISRRRRGWRLSRAGGSRSATCCRTACRRCWWSLTTQVARAITLEATLSFLGIGVPITEPSLGLLIANGYQYVLSGQYWISLYPGLALLLVILGINLVSDQVRDGLNPRGRIAEVAMLEVHDLRTEFATRAGVVRAVDGVSFNVERGPHPGAGRRVRLGQVRHRLLR